MAMAVMLSGQTYIALMDRIEHAHHHVHFANPLAGAVEFCGGVHDPSIISMATPRLCFSQRKASYSRFARQRRPAAKPNRLRLRA